MKILVTGSRGTLGTKLVAELRRRGHDVHGVDLDHCDDLQTYRCDVRESRQVIRAFEKVRPEVVYHLAAEFGRNNGEEYYEQLWTSNCLGTRNIIEACLKFDSHLVFASSSEAYGELELPEDKNALHEDLLLDHVPVFHNEYALSKWTNEKQIQIAIKNRQLSATILRFFNAYGPGESYHPYRSVVCLFIYRLLFGHPITIYRNYHRVFMYVDDWARTVSNVADTYTAYPSGEIFNIGGLEYRSIEDLHAMLMDCIGQSSSEVTFLEKEAANVTNKKPDNTKAIQMLGHNPSILLAEGLPLTVEWMKKKYL